MVKSIVQTGLPGQRNNGRIEAEAAQPNQRSSPYTRRRLLRTE